MFGKPARIAVVGALALVANACAAGVTVSDAPPVAVTKSTDLKPYVHNARLTRAVVLDNGALRLDPPTGSPAMTEARALELWQAEGGSGGRMIVVDAVAFFARVTLTNPIMPSVHRPVDQPAPAMRDRPTWVFMWAGGPHSCPAMRAVPTPTGPPPPAREDLKIIAADSTGQAVSYRTRGTFCGEAPTGPFASAATYTVSAEWALVKRTSKRCIGSGSPCYNYTNAVISITIPPCGFLSGGEFGGGPGGGVVGEYAEVPMTGSCAKGPTTVQQDVGFSSDNPVHIRTGLVQALASSGASGLDQLKYFDGRDRVITLPKQQ